DFMDKWPSLLGRAPDGKVLAVGSYNGDTIHIMDSTTGKRLQSLHDPSLKVRHVDFINNNKTLIVSCNDHTVQVWDGVHGVKLRQFAMGDQKDIGPLTTDGLGRGYAMALSPDCRWIAYSNLIDSLRLFDAATGKEVWRLNNSTKGGIG